MDTEISTNSITVNAKISLEEVYFTDIIDEEYYVCITKDIDPEFLLYRGYYHNLQPIFHERTFALSNFYSINKMVAKYYDYDTLIENTEVLEFKSPEEYYYALDCFINGVGCKLMVIKEFPICKFLYGSDKNGMYYCSTCKKDVPDMDCSEGPIKTRVVISNPNISLKVNHDLLYKCLIEVSHSGSLFNAPNSEYAKALNLIGMVNVGHNITLTELGKQVLNLFESSK